MAITIKAPHGADYRLHSFDEVAGQLDCLVGDLRRQVDAARHRFTATETSRGMIAGFRAIAVDGFKRLHVDRGSTLAFTPAIHPGFPGLYTVDEAWRALRFAAPVDFEDEARRLGIALINVEALTDEGRDWALRHLKHLAEERPPAGMGSVEIAEWRDQRQAVREAAAARPAAASRATRRKGGDALSRVSRKALAEAYSDDDLDDVA